MASSFLLAGEFCVKVAGPPSMAIAIDIPPVQIRAAGFVAGNHAVGLQRT